MERIRYAGPKIKGTKMKARPFKGGRAKARIWTVGRGIMESILHFLSGKVWSCWMLLFMIGAAIKSVLRSQGFGIWRSDFSKKTTQQRCSTCIWKIAALFQTELTDQVLCLLQP